MKPDPSKRRNPYKPSTMMEAFFLKISKRELIQTEKFMLLGIDWRGWRI
jgi:hypothetical protein